MILIVLFVMLKDFSKFSEEIKFSKKCRKI